MADSTDGEYVNQMARAEELTALAARAPNPAARVLYLQMASAFRQLARIRQKNDGAEPRSDR